MAVHCPADEAEATPQEDIDNLHLDDLEREHDVTVAVYSKAQAWIAASAETATAATSTGGLRRSGWNRASSWSVCGAGLVIFVRAMPKTVRGCSHQLRAGLAINDSSVFRKRLEF